MLWYSPKMQVEKPGVFKIKKKIKKKARADEHDRPRDLGH